MLLDRTFATELILIGVILVKIVKVLGEGGFSFVYLAQDEHSGVRRLFLSTYVTPG